MGFKWIKWVFFLLYGCGCFLGVVVGEKEAVSQGLGNCFCDLESSGKAVASFCCFSSVRLQLRLR